MKRLTDNNCGEYWLGSRNEGKAINKLGKLEDIEQELGIPLEVLFKALKEGVWMKSLNYKDKTISYHKQCVLNHQFKEWILWIGEYENTFMRELKDYGKTWALNSEELENV